MGGRGAAPALLGNVCKVLMEQTHEGSLLGTAQLHVGHAPRCQCWSQCGALRVMGDCRCYWGHILVFNVTMRIYHPSFRDSSKDFVFSANLHSVPLTGPSALPAGSERSEMLPAQQCWAAATAARLRAQDMLTNTMSIYSC